MPDALTLFGALAPAIADSVQALAVMLAGGWAYRKFNRTREDFPSLDVTVGLEVMGDHMSITGPARLAVVTATIRNHGTVRHKLSTLHFGMRTLLKNDLLERSDVAMGQVAFHNRLHYNQRFFPESWIWSFVEPGGTNVYRYSVIIPADVKFVLISAKLPLEGEDEFFSSWRIFNIETGS